MKNITILGSTGSIGTQALDVIRQNRDKYKVRTITAGRNADLLIKQIIEFCPDFAVVADESQTDFVKSATEGTGCKILGGKEALCDVAGDSQTDVVLTALVGYAGLAPTIRAIKAEKTIALANKETLVVAGDLVTNLCKQHNVKIYPVDSEHSAIFQCLQGEESNPISKIILTASGGPFRGKSREELTDVTPSMALKHPNWSMGAKITIDSASMMNKGFEVIEAKWLFDIDPDMIEVQVHPQSIIHSMVEFADGAVKAQLGTPDMRIPIAYALSYPHRWNLSGDRLDFAKCRNLTFEAPNQDVFRNLALAYEGLKRGGNACCVINAANEVAVSSFLNGRCTFLGMSDIIENTLDKISFVQSPSYDDYVKSDEEARKYALSLL